MTVAEVGEKLRRKHQFVLIDVREDHEWGAGRIRGAIHIGKGLIERDIERRIPGRRTEIVLYCAGGYRSVLAADALRKMGYRRTASMSGGWKAWKRARQRSGR